MVLELFGNTSLLRLYNTFYCINISLYLSRYPNVWNKLNYSTVIIYFIMFPFYYMLCFTGIPERLFLLDLRNIILPHYTFYCKHLPLVSGRIFISWTKYFTIAAFLREENHHKTYFTIIPFYQIWYVLDPCWKGFKFSP